MAESGGSSSTAVANVCAGGRARIRGKCEAGTKVVRVETSYKRNFRRYTPTTVLCMFPAQGTSPPALGPCQARSAEHAPQSVSSQAIPLTSSSCGTVGRKSRYLWGLGGRLGSSTFSATPAGLLFSRCPGPPSEEVAPLPVVPPAGSAPWAARRVLRNWPLGSHSIACSMRNVSSVSSLNLTCNETDTAQ